METNFPLIYECNECGSREYKQRVDNRLVLNVCSGCSHEGIVDVIPEPIPEPPVDIRDLMQSYENIRKY